MGSGAEAEAEKYARWDHELEGYCPFCLVPTGGPGGTGHHRDGCYLDGCSNDTAVRPERLAAWMEARTFTFEQVKAPVDLRFATEAEIEAWEDTVNRVLDECHIQMYTA